MILIVDNHSENLGEITRILRKYKVKYYSIAQNASFNRVNVKQTKGVILTGGGPNLDRLINLRQIRANIACLVNLKIPILGICEGHEIIGDACGGIISKLKKPSRYKSLHVNILKGSAIFKGLPSSIHVYESHGRFVEDIPPLLEVTATSHKDRIEGFFHKTKPIFGVQFHPERSGEHGEMIIKNFVDLCRRKSRVRNKKYNRD